MAALRRNTPGFGIDAARATVPDPIRAPLVPAAANVLTCWASTRAGLSQRRDRRLDQTPSNIYSLSDPTSANHRSPAVPPLRTHACAPQMHLRQSLRDFYLPAVAKTRLVLKGKKVHLSKPEREIKPERRWSCLADTEAPPIFAGASFYPNLSH